MLPDKIKDKAIAEAEAKPWKFATPAEILVGAEWLWTHLQQLTEPFDEEAAKREFDSGSHTYLDFTPKSLWHAACKWQFKKAQSTLAAKELEIERLKEYEWMYKDHQLLVKENESLKAQLLMLNENSRKLVEEADYFAYRQGREDSVDD